MLLIEGSQSLALIHGDVSYIKAAGETAIHQMVAAGVGIGLPTKIAFEWGMMLLCHGTTVPEARAMFSHCEVWRQ